MNVFFTADTHFGPGKYFEFTHRNERFVNVDHAADVMVENWNFVVGKRDFIYHLGDVANGDDGVGDQYLEAIMPRLNGIKFLLLGNHDHQLRRSLLETYFMKVSHEPFLLEICEEKIWCCHYPVQRHPEFYTLTGHIHDHWKYQRNMLNVGVDVWNFRPVSWMDVLHCVELERSGILDENTFPTEVKHGLFSGFGGQEVSHQPFPE